MTLSFIKAVLCRAKPLRLRLDLGVLAIDTCARLKISIDPAIAAYNDIAGQFSIAADLCCVLNPDVITQASPPVHDGMLTNEYAIVNECCVGNPTPPVWVLMLLIILECRNHNVCPPQMASAMTMQIAATCHAATLIAMTTPTVAIVPSIFLPAPTPELIGRASTRP
jgi:hypothetical protein